MRIYRLDKIVRRIAGNAAKFLNGLTSNSLDKPQNAFLNLHGRIIASFDQVKTGEDEYLICAAAPALPALLAHIEKFAKLNRTTIEQAGLNVYFDLDGDAPLEPKDHSISQRKGRLILTPRALANTVSDSVFTLFRLEYLLALHMIDYKDDMVLNVATDELVAFTKGCYLGQEPVAKVYNRSKPSWKLAVCEASQLSDEQRLKMTSTVMDPVTGQLKGFIFISNK